MGEGLLLGLSWLDGSVSIVLSERKEGLQGFFNSSLFVQSCRGKFLLFLMSFWFNFVFVW